MIVLTLTTSTDRGGLALFKDKKLLVEKSFPRKPQQSESLTPALSLILKTHKLTARDISAIVLDVGPGSFTGCRISASMAKTISQATGAVIFEATSLDALIFQNQSAKVQNILTLIDAHKSLFYTKFYRNSNYEKIELLNEELVEKIAVKDLFVAGIYPAALKAKFKLKKVRFPSQSSHNHPFGRTLGRMLFESPKLLKERDWKHVEPLYIRAPDVVEKFQQNIK